MLLVFATVQCGAITNLGDVRSGEKIADDLYDMVNDRRLQQDLLDAGVNFAGNIH